METHAERPSLRSLWNRLRRQWGETPRWKGSPRSPSQHPVVNEIGRLLFSALEMDQVVQILHEQVGRVLDTQFFYIALYDEERQLWKTVLDIMDGEPRPTAHYSAAEGLTGYVIRNRQPLLFHTKAELSRFLAEQGVSGIGEAPQSWLGVPLTTAGRVVGVIGVECYDRPHTFSRSDLSFLSTVADLAAVAVENARRYEESRRRSGDLNALFAVGTAILSTLDLQTILNAVCREAVHLLSATSAYICDLDEARGVSTVVAEYYGAEASDQERASDMGASYEEPEEQLANLRAGRPYTVRLSAPDLAPQEREYLMQYGGKNTLLLPLRARERILGYIEVWESRYDRSFTQEEILLGQNLASQAAIAIENARLLQTVRETVRALSTAAAEILSAAGQQTSGASEQSVAIAQASTTIDEVRAIADQTTEHAQGVAERAQQIAQVSTTGQVAIDESIAGVGEVREKVKSIARDVLALSDQAQAIGRIVATVNEIAAQSNMLALNAAIEAARAGEAGKGFAVVAQEVRSLAQRSRAATAQVRELLSEIQHGVNTAVMSTEEGAKRSHVGVQLVGEAGAAIRQLAEEVSASIQAAVKIAAAADEQLVGMEQIAVAMENIRRVTAQNVAGAQQVERAAGELNALAGRLRELVEQSGPSPS